MHSLSPRRASRRIRCDRAQPSRCAAARRDRFQPSNGKFPSFWDRDVRFAQINWLQRWGKKAALRLLRKSGQHERRRKTNQEAIELREQLRRKDWHRRFQQFEFRSQVLLGKQRWA